MIWFNNMFVVGRIPEFFDETDPRPAREQADENYAHGGGCHPTPNLKLRIEGDAYVLDSVFSEDPPMRELSRAKLIEPTVPVQRRSTVWSHPAFAMQSVFARNDGELVRVSLAR